MMIGGLSALILLGAIYQTVEVPQRISTTVAELGGNVTLTCATSDQGSNVYIWYKMTLGNVPQTVATVTLDKTTITEPNEQRFTVAKEKDHYVLTIQNVNKDDEGTYFCQSGTSFYQTFTNGIFVAIREARVHCSGEHNVYWFKAGPGESHPTIYTHVRNGDKPEEKSCVYNLSQSRDCSGSGTYYCAVVSCGEILSGEETTEDTSTRNVPESGSKLDPVVLVLGALLFCCVTAIVVLSYFIKRLKRCALHEGEMSVSLPPGHHKTTGDQPSDLAVVVHNRSCNMMMGGLSALILLGTIYQTVEVPQTISTTVAELGGNVTLMCVTSDQGSNVYVWHKMTLGNVPQTVATVTLYQTTITEPNEQRFTVAKEKDHYVLTIQNVNKDDEGTYFCQSGTSFHQKFTNGIFVAIRETRVHCPGEHNVYWFKAGSGESHPTIYSHVRNGDKPEEKSCVYSLSQSRACSDSGTYYCAVVSCGEILSGEETIEDTSTKNVPELRSKLDQVVLVLGALLFCCVTVIVVLSNFIKRLKCRDHHEGEMSASLLLGRHKTTVDQPSDLDDEVTVVNYTALSITTRKLMKEE